MYILLEVYTFSWNSIFSQRVNRAPLWTINGPIWTTIYSRVCWGGGVFLLTVWVYQPFRKLIC